MLSCAVCRLNRSFGVPCRYELMLFWNVLWSTVLIETLTLVAAVVLYDMFVVPHTKRGKYYRAQVLRRRTSAARL